MQSIKWHKTAWDIIVLLVPAMVIYGFYTKLFTCPECFLFLDSGDGLKNYYTLAYYVLHDTGWHFTGMNYPYGEHVIYTDNQPLLAMALRWVHHHVIPMDRHLIGTMNMLLVLSLYAGVLVNYKLLRRWRVGKWWALATSLCIIFLSPQIIRFGGHYALGYVCFFPLMLLFLDYLVRGPGKKWIWGLSIGLLIFCASLVHMYYLFLLELVAGSFLLFWAVYNRKNKSLLRPVIVVLTSAILIPGMLLVGIRKYTDPVKDRPTEPWGMDYHCVDFSSTFFSFIPPFDQAWTKFFGKEKPIIEKVAYTGFVGLCMLPVILYFLFRKKEDDPVSVVVKAFTGAAVIAWCMGAGVFYQNGFKILWEAIPVLKQFRGLGRFGLPFYYLYTLACSYLLWRFYLQMREREMRSVGGYILGLSILIWGFEARGHMIDQTTHIYRVNQTLHDSKDDYLPILTAAGYTPGDFQAILLLPLVAIGNENMGVSRGFWASRVGMHVSWETGLPMIDYVMSRTSVSQGLDIVELISTPYAPKRRASLFNDKPILLVYEEDEAIPAEKKWKDQAVLLGSKPPTSLYALPAAAFKTVIDPLANGTVRIASCTGWFNGFDDFPCDTTMSGKGALPILSAPQSIWSYQDTSAIERQWTVSFWTYVDNVHAAVSVPRMMEKDPQGTITLNSGLHRDNILWSEGYGQWLEVNMPLTTKGKGYTYELFIDNTGPVIDNLLIRPTSDTCVYAFPELVLYNNLPIPVR